MTQSTNAFMEANVMYSTRAIEGISSCAVHLANGRVVPLIPRDPTLPPAHRISASAEIRMYPFNTSPLFFLLLTDLYYITVLAPQMVFTDAQEHLIVWMPVLTSLSDVLSSHDLHSVRLWYVSSLSLTLNPTCQICHTIRAQHNITSSLVRLILWKECLCCLDPCSPRDCGR